MKFSYAADARPVDGFTIRRGIHRGGFGEVYYAVSDAGKEVALKLLTHDLDTELRGIRQCLNLKHPNLVTIFDVKTDADGDQWVVMEYVNGSNLEEVLTAFPQGLPLREVHDWMSGLVAGVEYLHDRGLIHRDLKPANVYRENGVVKIGDVGLSKRFDGDRRNQHTESIGTVYYMAPEITHGKYGPAVDVYSLGIILYELLTGKLPFNGETSGEILMKQLSAAPDLSAVPPPLKPVLAHALEKDPQRRTPSARQLWTEFEQALSPPTAIPDANFESLRGSQFVNWSDVYVAPEAARKDTDRSGDTGRKVNRKGKPDRPTTLAYEMGRIYGEVTTPARPRPRETWKPDALSPIEKTHRTMEGVIFIGIVLGLLLFPWSAFNWGKFGREFGPYVIPAGLVVFVLWQFRGRIRGISRSLGVGGTPTSSASSPRRTPTPQQQTEIRADWSGTFAVGALAAGLFALVGQLATANLSHRYDLLSRPEMTVFFTAVAVIGTWAVCGGRWLSEKLGWGARHPRMLYASVGLAVATLAAALDDYLLIDIGPAQRLTGKAVFDHLGVNPLRTESGLEPAWLGYVVFFTGVFFLLGKRLNAMQDISRPERWRFRHVIVAALACVVWTQVFAFPQLIGLLWAATIVAAVQLASPWQPRPLPPPRR